VPARLQLLAAAISPGMADARHRLPRGLPSSLPGSVTPGSTMAKNSTLDKLREIDRLTLRINQQLETMFVRLGKVVVAAETANEALSGLLSTAQHIESAENVGTIGSDGASR